MANIFDTPTKRWEYAQGYMHNGEAWEEVFQGMPDEAYTLESMFIPGRYIGEGTILQRDVSSMPLHRQNDEMTAFMVEATPFAPNGAFGNKTSVNTSQYGTQPIHAYIVDSTHPACRFQKWDGVTASATPQIETDTYMNGYIPMPQWAHPAIGGDEGIAIYDKGTGIMREVFGMRWDSAKSRWTTQPLKPGDAAGGGGYSLNKPGLRDLKNDNYALQQRRGLSNVAGMHNSLGFIGISEALAGKINHALCFTLSAARMTWPDGSPGYISYPSRGSDGKLENYLPGGSQYARGRVWSGGTVTPTHGQWARLRADVDPQFNPNTGKPYGLFTQVLIEAAKKYGLVATDTNLAVHAFNCEQGVTWKHMYGEDPWVKGGLIERRYVNPETGKSEFHASDFPWDMVEWAEIDWGRPSPDLNLRPGQLVPWMGGGA